MPDDSNELLEPAEIASLMNSAIGVLSCSVEVPGIDGGDGPNGPTPPPLPEFARLDAEAVLSHCLAEARPFELPSFDNETEESFCDAASTIADTDVEVQIELGRALLPLDEREALCDGAVVSLDKRAGEPVDILAGGRLIARGEVLVRNDKLCVRVAEIIGASSVIETRKEAVR